MKKVLINKCVCVCVCSVFVSGKRHGRTQARCFWTTMSMKKTSASPPTGKSSWKFLMVTLILKFLSNTLQWVTVGFFFCIVGLLDH